MKNNLIPAIGAGILLLFLGCGTTPNTATRSMTSIERQASEVPARFEAPIGVERTSNACVTPLIDPRDNTTIKLITSFGDQEIGDYEVPSGQYGVQKNELLRINCRTGDVLGIVMR